MFEKRLNVWKTFKCLQIKIEKSEKNFGEILPSENWRDKLKRG